MHILPPLENAQNHFFISATSLEFPSHRSGLKTRGSGKTSAFRCKVYGDMLTTVLAGILYPPMTQSTERLLGSEAGRGAYNLRVSLMTASRYGSLPVASA